MRMLLAGETCGFMGFPRGYQYPDSITLATFMFGNAVAPPVARDVITAIREAA
jgi:DNA (cytosine-5)-methyltransferase 1